MFYKILDHCSSKVSKSQQTKTIELAQIGGKETYMVGKCDAGFWTEPRNRKRTSLVEKLGILLKVCSLLIVMDHS